MALTPDETPSPSPTPGASAEVFVPLLSATHHRIYASILALVPDRHGADEIMQETSLVLWRRFEDFRPGEDAVNSFARWGVGIAYNLARKWMRAAQRDRLVFGEELIDKITRARESNAELLDARLDALTGCIERLSDSDRELVRHCYGGSTRSFKQKAQEIDRPVNTVYKALNRIRAALYRCVERAVRREDSA